MLDEDEFTVLFTKRISELSAEKGLPFGKEPSEYARTVARAYWLSLHAEGWSPQECADEMPPIGLNPLTGHHRARICSTDISTFPKLYVRRELL